MEHISLALATYNEESNIVACIESCNGLVDEIVVVDGSSTDKTPELALKAGATVICTHNVSMFHINKQKAIDACSGEWILQLDADERVTPELAAEIRRIIQMTNEEIEDYQKDLKERQLFLRHQQLVFNLKLETQNLQNKKLQVTSYKLQDSYSAFFIPRLNFFLGGYLRYGGVYPDGVIRLIKKGKAWLPCKDVHELMEVDGKTGWLANPLIHKDSPTFQRYLERNSRYIDHVVEELKTSCSLKLEASNLQNKKFQVLSFKFQTALDWLFIKPITTFFSLLIRHKGILDGWRGVVWAFFSSIRFARAYWRYLRS
jgi:glycosyltransferase involved in cell wall biosynthesis